MADLETSHATLDHSGLGGVGATDHGALTGLADDDHPQYASNTEFDDHSARHEDGGADEISIAGLAGTPIAVSDHTGDTTDAHDASAISFTPTGTIAATDVQAAIAEVAAEAGTPADIKDIPTAETDTTKRLAPDGAGGVAWGTGGAGSVPDGTAVGQIPVWSGTAWELLPIGGDGGVLTTDFGRVLKVKWSVTPAGSGYADLVLAMANLVAYWRFDETTGTTAVDSGPNGLDLTLGTGIAVNGSSLLGGGQSGGSFDFDGGTNAGATHVDDALLDLGDAVSMVAIIRPSSVTGARGILSKQGNAYYLRTNGTNLEFLKAGSSVIVASTGVTLATSTSYLVAGAKNGATTKLYVNGVDRTGSVTNDTLTNNASDIAIGCSTPNVERFGGLIAEVALFSRAITATEVTDLFTTSGL